MKILIIGLDKSVVRRKSSANMRLVALSDLAQKIDVIVPGDQDECEEFSEKLRIHAVPGTKIIQLWKIWKTGKKLISDTLYNHPRLGQARYKLISVQDIYFLALIGLFLSRKFDIPIEIQVHGLEKFTGIRKLIGSYAMRRAHKLRVVSERLKDFLKSNLKIPESRIYVLPVYAQVKHEAPSFTESDLETRPFTFLTVGRLVKVKNVELQIRAFSTFLREFSNSRLVIVGGGPLLENLKLKVKSLRLEKNIIFEGLQENVAKYYAQADAFLLTSDAEGWGRVVVEAASYGLPIIMTEVGLAQEFIINDESGIVIRPGDQEALYSAMKKITLDAGYRQKIGNRAREAFFRLSSPEYLIKEQIRQWEGLM